MKLRAVVDVEDGVDEADDRGGSCDSPSIVSGDTASDVHDSGELLDDCVDEGDEQPLVQGDRGAIALSCRSRVGGRSGAVRFVQSDAAAVAGEVSHSGNDSPRRATAVTSQPLPLPLPLSYAELGGDKGDSPGMAASTGSMARPCGRRREEAVGADCEADRGGGSGASRQS